MDTPRANAERLYRILSEGAGRQKTAAIQDLDNNRKSYDNEYLLEMAFKGITDDFSPQKDPECQDPEYTDVRCWLNAVVGRLAKPEDEAAKVILKRVFREHEPYLWARFWALEGLIVGDLLDVEKLCRDILAQTVDPHPLVSSMALVYLAKCGDLEILQRVIEMLEPQMLEGRLKVKGECWAILRSLRVTPLVHAKVLQHVAFIAEKGRYQDVSYDAIVALGALPPKTTRAEEASQALIACIKKHPYPMYDLMRARAVQGLGQLQIGFTADAVLEEMDDPNPMIAKEAAIALERILGTEEAVQRTIAWAKIRTQVDRRACAKLAAGLRWMADRKMVITTLEMAMQGSGDQSGLARALMADLGGSDAFKRLQAQRKNAERYVEDAKSSDERIHNLFDQSISDARRGINLLNFMNASLFWAGIIFTCAALIRIFTSTDGEIDSFSATSGIGGVVSMVLGRLVNNPKKQIENGIDLLNRLNIIFLGYVRGLQQVDRAFARRMLDEKPISMQELNAFSVQTKQTMAEALRMLSSKATTEVKPQPHAAAAVEEDPTT